MTDVEITLDDIIPKLNTMPVVYFATTVDDQPRVRPMALIFHDGNYYLTSRSYEVKMMEIKQNSKMEFSFFVVNEDKSNWNIRAAGQAFVVKDLEVKTAAVKAITFFDHYWTGPNDPNYALISLKIDKVKVNDSKTKNRYEFDWKE